MGPEQLVRIACEAMMPLLMVPGELGNGLMAKLACLDMCAYMDQPRLASGRRRLSALSEVRQIGRGGRRWAAALRYHN